jgi:hypothetical protein
MEQMTKKLLFVPALLILSFLSACATQASVCLPGTGTPDFLTVPPNELPIPSPAVPAQVEINGKPVQVDKVVEGPLCNDTWSGTVYVTCNVQVYPWKDERQPLFLNGCDLDIAPNTVVYVADHNDTAYYNGCSCHTGEIGEP